MQNKCNMQNKSSYRSVVCELSFNPCKINSETQKTWGVTGGATEGWQRTVGDGGEDASHLI